MRNKILILVIIAVCTITLIACGNKRANNSEQASKIFDRVNNNSDKDEIVTKSTPREEIDSYKIVNMSINDFHKKFGIECLRKSGEYYYSIHKVNEGGYLYVFYKQDTNSYYICGRAYIIKSLKKEDFNIVEKGKTTLDDVFKIDPTSKLNKDNIGELSDHFLINGDSYRFRYSDLNGVKVVSDILYTPPNSKSIYRLILPKDLPN